MVGTIYLEDGTVFKGIGIGSKGTSIGEIVFNTSMTGYQEILTDPSYAGQIINMTYPLIGNYGINSFENESRKIFARGLIVKSASDFPSNYMSEKKLDDMLKENGVVGICGVDTRKITKKIRSSGSLKCVISNEDVSEKELAEYMKAHKLKEEYLSEVSTDKIYNIPGDGNKVVLMDFGVKKHIIENLKDRKCDITVVPYNTSYEKIMSFNPDGVFLSNGPGDPKSAKDAIINVRKIVNKVPVFGICLGHQILALAFGGDTYKMKFGHRGSNHGVYDIDRDKAYITSQNHGYAVNPESITGKGIRITHVNLNDNTIEGLAHNTLPVFSVQFHPEGSPGPTDTSYLFDKFINYMNIGKGGDKNAIR